VTGLTLRVNRSHFPVTALGPGIRLGIWLQGCPLACKGCMSRDTWDPAGGTESDTAGLVREWRVAIERGATGLTISGGEPLAQAAGLGQLLEEVRAVNKEFEGEFDILVFTGYEFAELDAGQRDTARLADVLVTGRYEAGAPTDLLWRGSANQRMIALSELGRRRYAAVFDARPAEVPVQARVDERGLWIVGVPRPGLLPALDRKLREHGLAVGESTWRQPHAGHQSAGDEDA